MTVLFCTVPRETLLVGWRLLRSDGVENMRRLNMKPRKHKKNGKADSFDPEDFLNTAGVARKVSDFRRGESIYSQGEAAESVMYVQKGGVKFSVVNGSGKEAVVAMFGPSDFFGEGCMAGQTIRMGTATAITPTTLLVIEKDELLRVLHASFGVCHPLLTSIYNTPNLVTDAFYQANSAGDGGDCPCYVCARLPSYVDA